MSDDGAPKGRTDTTPQGRSDEQSQETETQPQGASQDEQPQGHESDEQQQQSDEQSDEQPDESTDWKAEAQKWKAEARRQQRYAKGEAGPLNEKIDKLSGENDELRKQVADQDAAQVESASELAAAQLHTKLARAGLGEQDATALIDHLDPLRLLDDGKPSPDAIDSLASSLSRSLGRGVDDDQGQRSDGPSFSADEWLRRKARK